MGVEAINSARQMDSILKGIQGHGSVLLSNQDRPITKDSLLKAIYDLKQTIRLDKVKNPAINPLIVFYYMGHGLGMSDSYLQYFVLGDYDFSNLNHLNLKSVTENQMFSDYTVSADELANNFYLFSVNDDDKYLDSMFINNEYNKFIINYMKDSLGKTDDKKKLNKLNEILNKFGMKFNTDISRQTDTNAMSEAENLAARNIVSPAVGISNSPNINEYINNFAKQFNPVLTENKILKQHVPYILIIDSCANGIEGMLDFINKAEKEWLLKNKDKKWWDYLSDSDKKNPAIKNIIESQNNVKIDDIYQRQQQLDREIEMRKISISEITAATVIFVRGDTFKKYGALFFSTNPGGKIYPIGTSEFSENKDKTGVLARRFQLAVSGAKLYSKQVTLENFLELFDNTKLDAKTEKSLSWFAPSPDISKTIFIEN